MSIRIEDVRATIHHADTRLCLASRLDLEVALGHLVDAQAQLKLVLIEHARAERNQLTLPHALVECA
jgi:hypothetical protein